MLFMAASSASVVDPPTPTVITSPFQLSSPKPALYQDICRAVSPAFAAIRTNATEAPNGQLSELKLSV